MAGGKRTSKESGEGGEAKVSIFSQFQGKLRFFFSKPNWTKIQRIGEQLTGLAQGGWRLPLGMLQVISGNYIIGRRTFLWYANKPEGLRACAVNGGAEYLTHEAPDILCLQVLFLNHFQKCRILSGVIAEGICRMGIFCEINCWCVGNKSIREESASRVPKHWRLPPFLLVGCRQGGILKVDEKN